MVEFYILASEALRKKKYNLRSVRSIFFKMIYCSVQQYTFHYLVTLLIFLPRGRQNQQLYQVGSTEERLWEIELYIYIYIFGASSNIA